MDKDNYNTAKFAIAMLAIAFFIGAIFGAGAVALAWAVTG